MSHFTAPRRQQGPGLGDPLHAQSVATRPACRLRWAVPWLEQRRRQRQQVAASNGGAAQQLRHRPTVSSALPDRQYEQPQDLESDEALLLDLLLPGAVPEAVVRAIFGLHGTGDAGAGDAGMLTAFLQQHLGCTGLACEPWMISSSGNGGGSSRSGSSCSGSSGGSRIIRALTYRTPLSVRQRLLLPLGPAYVNNRDEQDLEWHPSSSSRSSSGGASVHCRCTSAGVPFADCFTNLLHWEVLPAGETTSSAAAHTAVLQPCGSSSSGGGGGTRVRLSARCSFHKPVLGPLRGIIAQESMQGMHDAYAGFGAVLQARLSAVGSSGSGSAGSPVAGVSNVARSSCLSSGLERAISPTRRPANAAPSGAAVGGVGGASATAAAGAGVAGLAAAAAAAAAGAADSSYRTRGGGSSSWVAAKDMVSEHLNADSPDGLLAETSALWPDWSAEGCRLPAPGAALPAFGKARAGAPSADEAAAVLHAVAWSANRTPMAERRQLARNRVVRGLVEALRLLPPHSGSGSGSGSGAQAGQQLTCPKAVARALWALAMLGGSVYWEEEAEALCALLPAHPCVNLSQAAMVATALARMRHYTENLVLVEQAAVEAVQAHLEEAYAVQAHLQQAADVAGARADAAASSSGGRGGGDAARGASGGVVPTQSWPSVRKLSDLVWGLASLGHKPLLLLDLLPTVLSGSSDGSGGSGGGGGGGRGAARRQFELACRLGWSLAAAGCLQHPASAAVAGELAAAASRLPSGAASSGHLLQLHQFVLALSLEASPAVQQGRREQEEYGDEGREVEGGAASAPAGDTPAADVGQQNAAAALRLLHQEPAAALLLREAEETWQTEGCRRSSKQVSACQADVAGTARTGLGLRVEEEYSVDGISVDIAAPSRGLAIEVDGPTHFCRNSDARPRPVGGTLLKRRLLQGLGWVVVSVDAAEWEELRGPVQKRRALGNAILAAEEASAEWIEE